MFIKEKVPPELWNEANKLNTQEKELKEKIDILLGKTIGDSEEKLLEEREEKMRQRRVEKKQEFINWVKENLPLDKKTKGVEFNKVPKAFKGELKKQVKIAFWRAKRTVCRPYPKK